MTTTQGEVGFCVACVTSAVSSPSIGVTTMPFGTVEAVDGSCDCDSDCDGSATGSSIVATSEPRLSSEGLLETVEGADAISVVIFVAAAVEIEDDDDDDDDDVEVADEVDEDGVDAAVEPLCNSSEADGVEALWCGGGRADAEVDCAVLAEVGVVADAGVLDAVAAVVTEASSTLPGVEVSGIGVELAVLERVRVPGVAPDFSAIVRSDSLPSVRSGAEGSSVLRRC